MLTAACGGSGQVSSNSQKSTSIPRASSVVPIAPQSEGVWRVRWEPTRPGVVISASRTRLWLTSDGGDSWRQATPLIDGLGGATGSLNGPRLVDADFRDALHGIALAERLVAGSWRIEAFRTDDGGAGWTTLGAIASRTGDPSETVNVSIIDTKTVHLFIRNPNLAAGRFLVSSDAGSSWTSRGGTSTPALAVRFSDAENGVGLSTQRQVMTSADGGNTRLALESPPESSTGGAFSEVPYPLPSGAVLLGRLTVEPEGVVRTWWWAEEPGAVWVPLGGARPSGQEVTPFATDAASVVAAGLWWDVGTKASSSGTAVNPTVTVTTTAGAEWATAAWPYPTISGLYAVDEYVAWAQAGPTLFRTLDGGVSWQRLVPGGIARPAPTLTTGSTSPQTTSSTAAR